MLTPDFVNAGRQGSFVAAVDVPLTAVVTDLGGTTATEIWVGDQRATTFHTHTRHLDTALSAANEVLAAALAPLIEAAATAQGLTLHDPTSDVDGC